MRHSCKIQSVIWLNQMLSCVSISNENIIASSHSKKICIQNTEVKGSAIHALSWLSCGWWHQSDLPICDKCYLRACTLCTLRDF